jgi:hypothetical protein
MGALALPKRLESLLENSRVWQTPRPVETIPTGILEIDLACGGLPRGSLTEIFGPQSSGRMSLLLSILAAATRQADVCALVDAEDAFDPCSAAAAGVRLERLLWVRCPHSAEQALKAADLLVQGGGFGLVAMDLGDTSSQSAWRISLASWFRLRRAVEHTPTVLVTVARQSNAGTCAGLQLECARRRTEWSGARGVSRLLREAETRVTAERKSRRSGTCSPVFTAAAI